MKEYTMTALKRFALFVGILATVLAVISIAGARGAEAKTRHKVQHITGTFEFTYEKRVKRHKKVRARQVMFDVAAIQAYGDDHRYPVMRQSAQPMGRRINTAPSNGYDMAQIVDHPSGCPRTRFCGCGVSVKVFGHPVRNLFLAANWYKFPRTPPSAGMVAIFGKRHVAYIMSVDGGGNATLYDPNSGGHKTRIHTRNIANTTVVNPHGSRMAQL